MDADEEQEEVKNDLTFDQVFKKIKNYGWYQVFILCTIQCVAFSQAANMAGGLYALGGLIPTYSCTDDNNTFVYDKKNISKHSAEACVAIRSCQNLTKENAWLSMYEEFEWMCNPPHLLSTLASVSPIVGAVGFLVSGHLSDHLGRKWPSIAGLCVSIFGGLLIAIAPNWQIYFGINIVKSLLLPTYGGASFTLCMESVGSKWRLVQSFAFQFTIANVYAGLMAYLTHNWRLHYAVVNLLALPALVMFLFIEESPRWTVQKHKYAEAAKSINKIARWNRRPNVIHTENDMKRIDLGSHAHNHHYNIFHLFSQKKLALYCLSQIATGMCMNMVTTVLLMNIQDLAGSPFLNIALMGLLRSWTPLAAIAMERYSSWFGRKPLLVGAQGVVCLCFSAIIVISVTGYWDKLHALASGLALFGYAVEIGLVWVAYKTYTVELFPTVIRTIAVNTFSLSSMLGSILAPQLIYLKTFWHPMPYAGAALISLISIVLAVLILPETKGKPMPDSLEEVKDGRMPVPAVDGKELDQLVPTKERK
uniref:Major facilitator superfamily (MFS) profile domain-containing protein n=1 Tax=Plectus sambesii TaxID=2011161 RepID=A0A914VH80_9BILA